MSSLTLPVLLIFMIVICTLSSVSSDCASCCVFGTGCNTAFKGEPGQCCSQGLLSGYCCPTSSVCISNNQCRILYFGMSLGVLIAVIVGIIVGCSLLITLCCRLCRSQPPPVTHTMILTPSFHNPGVHQITSPAAASYKY